MSRLLPLAVLLAGASVFAVGLGPGAGRRLPPHRRAAGREGLHHQPAQWRHGEEPGDWWSSACRAWASRPPACRSRTPAITTC